VFMFRVIHAVEIFVNKDAFSVCGAVRGGAN
jgi:hypothetical protein